MHSGRQNRIDCLVPSTPWICTISKKYWIKLAWSYAKVYPLSNNMSAVSQSSLFAKLGDLWVLHWAAKRRPQTRQIALSLLGVSIQPARKFRFRPIVLDHNIIWIKVTAWFSQALCFCSAVWIGGSACLLFRFLVVAACRLSRPWQIHL
jgi:hypothetical protein